ncbi:ribose-phosphate diphosphokinase [Candidatus Nitrosocosmicus hydrocola]|uniref:ribose-phosphate diphosphokinase n=1 Tax=Candidatus Nitrosocosmicus hydrocola TaxID=1826872 RepID=UPI000B146E32|nr:ribose-phosphate diphosphokinase [Candidatus Nitrosocosmicus hydrocola]
MKDIAVLPGPSSITLGTSIASSLNVDPVEVELRTFSDGESKIRINANLVNKRCVVVQSTFPPVDSHYLQTLMMLSYCIKSGAAEVIPVVPYMGYARQDRTFLEGEVVTMALISKLFDCFQINNLVTNDIHSSTALSCFNLNVSNISSIPLLAKYAQSNFNLIDPLIVSPDQGGATRAKLFSDILKTSSINLRKKRDRETGNITIEENLDIVAKDRDIVLVDDMISSGGTIMKAIDVLKKNDCNRIFVMCVHALSDEKSLDALRKTGIHDLISTNSIPRSCSKIDLSDEIAKTLSLILDI